MIGGERRQTVEELDRPDGPHSPQLDEVLPSLGVGVGASPRLDGDDVERAVDGGSIRAIADTVTPHQQQALGEQNPAANS